MAARSLRSSLAAADALAHRWLVAHSIALLRISLGAVFLGFGILKYFPGVSPAQGLAEAATRKLTFGVVPSGATIVVVATLECLIGLFLITGRHLRIAVYLLAVELVGILSPVVLLSGRLFSGPHGAPTLEGQYVLKDVILVGAGMVVAATLRGGRLVRGADSAQPTVHGDASASFTAREKLAIVLEGFRDEVPVARIAGTHGIDEGDVRRWRDEMIDGALAALASHDEPPPELPAPRAPAG